MVRVAGLGHRPGIDIAFANAAFGDRPLPDTESLKDPRRRQATRALKWWLREAKLPHVGGWAVEALVLGLHTDQPSGLALFDRIIAWIEARANPSAVESLLRPHARPKWHDAWSAKLPGRLEAIRNGARALQRRRPASLDSWEQVETRAGWPPVKNSGVSYWAPGHRIRGYQQPLAGGGPWPARSHRAPTTSVPT